MLKPIWKRTICGALALALCASLAACGGSTGDSGNAGSTEGGAPATDSGDTAGSDNGTDAPAADGDAQVITFFHRWPNEPKNPIFYEYVAEFEANNPGVTIEMDYVLNDSYKEKIRVLISGDSVPDVFTSWSYSFAENLVSSGNVAALDDLVAADSALADSLIPTQLEGFTFDGKLYGLPLSMDGKVFYYNKDIFAEHGKDVPATLDELYALMDEFVEAGYETPLLEGLADAWAVSHYQGTIIQRVLDPAILDADCDKSTGTFTDPGYIDALNIFKRLTEYMGTAAPAMDHETARNTFIAGEIPLFYAQLAEIRLINGSASSGGDKSGADFEFGFFNFPSVPGGLGDQTGLTGAPEGYMMSTKAPAIAADFLKYLASVEAGEKMTKESGELSAIYGAVNENTADSDMMAAVDMIMSATSTVPWFDNAVEASIADAFMRGGQSLAIGDMTAEEVMAEVIAIAETVRTENQ